MAEDITEIKLRVGELTSREDFGRGIVRIGGKYMKMLGVSEGDVVEIEGKRKTPAIVVRAYPADVGMDVIRMDGLERKNCKAGISEPVTVRKVEINEAKSVTIAPARKGFMIHMEGNIMKQNLYMRPLNVGDIIVPNPVIRKKRNVNNSFEQLFGVDLGSVGFGEIIDTFANMGFAGGEKFVVVSTDPKGYVRIGEETEVELLPQATKPLEEEKIPEVTYEDLGGLHEEIGKVREMIELPLKHPEIFERLGIESPKGILLHGPPGCGKTLLAKAVANESGTKFYLINGPEIMSKFYGESEENLRKVFDEAEKNAPSIIFVDEIDAIAPKREEVKGEVEKRVVSQLLTLLDGLKSRGKIIVIGATNIPNALDPALRRPGRFDREIEVAVPNVKGRKEILQIHTRGMPMFSINSHLADMKLKDDMKNTIIDFWNKQTKDKTTGKLRSDLKKYLSDYLKENKTKIKDEELEQTIRKILRKNNIVRLDDLSAVTYGYVGADLAALSKEAAMHALKRVLPYLGTIKDDTVISQEELKKLIVTNDDFEHALKMVEPSAMREVLIEIPNVSWRDIGGLDGVKKQMKEAIEWPLTYPEMFRRLGIQPPKGIMLYGPPGCGKTMMAKAIANESGANFISIKGPEILSMWVGESEKKLREIFRRAKQVAPSIIFFDEIDALVPRRGRDGAGTQVSERIVSQLLVEMSGLEELHDIVIIAATNRPDIIDPALLRPGRFDRHILVPTPDKDARFEIFNVHTKAMPLAKDVNLKKFAEDSEGFSGADIEAIVREAGLNAMRIVIKANDENVKITEVTKKDFENAVKEITPSVTKDMNEFYESVLKKRTKTKIEDDGMEKYTG
ncbi:CDC48 family AAA ATPase [Candidatus Aenigmatarchaeota archaeon]